jgi:hypothetical protein
MRLSLDLLFSNLTFLQLGIPFTRDTFSVLAALKRACTHLLLMSCLDSTAGIRLMSVCSVTVSSDSDNHIIQQPVPFFSTKSQYMTKFDPIGQPQAFGSDGSTTQKPNLVELVQSDFFQQTYLLILEFFSGAQQIPIFWTKSRCEAKFRSAHATVSTSYCSEVMGALHRKLRGDRVWSRNTLLKRTVLDMLGQFSINVALPVFQMCEWPLTMYWMLRVLFFISVSRSMILFVFGCCCCHRLQLRISIESSHHFRSSTSRKNRDLTWII